MCISPLWIRKVQQEVPCGKCFECVKRRRNDWYIRCLYESQQKKFTYFGLLTYAKVGMKLKKRDIQLFLKRLRIKGYKFSYLIVGEHGEKRDRPHWHALFFSDSPINYRDISASWRGGYAKNLENISGWIRFEIIRSPRAIRYTTKYIYKYDGLDPRFTLMVSKNPAIGKGFLNSQRYFLERKSTAFTINGKPVAMPRYYKRKIFDDYPDIKEEVNAGLAAKVAEIRAREIEIARQHYPELNDLELINKIKENKFLYNEQQRERERIARYFRKAFFHP